jgi:hypothetical protein
MIRLGRLKATSSDISHHDVRSVSKGFRSQMPHESNRGNK